MLKVLSYISVKRLTPAPAIIFYVSMNPGADTPLKAEGPQRNPVSLSPMVFTWPRLPTP